MLSPAPRRLPSPFSWWPALVGLFLFVLAVLALSGPGRIDIIDGQPRYEVARSLVDHGDILIRDPDIWFAIAPGRDGHTYSAYRFPQSALGVGAILLADSTGPRSEPRRHFFFLLSSALAGAVLAVLYAVWFAEQGYPAVSAIGWALAGIFCTPNWFYSTTSFDDILGTTAVVLALTLAWISRRRQSVLWAGAAGLALGLAFNCKQPLGIFALPVIALVWLGSQRLRDQAGRLTAVLMGLGLGAIVHLAYEQYKFPHGLDITQMQYVPPVWGISPLAGLVTLLVSPSAGVLWYCPPILLSAFGLARIWRVERIWAIAILVATAGFTSFIVLLSFFKGDIAWGPRYLTPVLGVLWLFAPAGAAALPGRAPLLLALGFLVQVLGLSVEPHRLYIERNIPSGLYIVKPWIYCDPRVAHLVNRPREIWAILNRTDQAEAFSPAPSPTYALPLHDLLGGPQAIHRYYVFDSFRPWWASQIYLPSSERPVALAQTAGLLLALAAAGLLLLGLALRPPRSEVHRTPLLGSEVNPSQPGTYHLAPDTGGRTPHHETVEMEENS
jgi:hypothetical protein